jgi:hypothetical protein
MGRNLHRWGAVDNFSGAQQLGSGGAWLSAFSLQLSARSWLGEGCAFPGAQRRGTLETHFLCWVCRMAGGGLWFPPFFAKNAEKDRAARVVAGFAAPLRGAGTLFGGLTQD